MTEPIFFLRDYDSGEVRVMGTIPKRIGVTEEFIEGAEGVRRDGDDVYLDTVPPLHLRILYPHPEIPRAVVAEVVTA